MKKITAFNTVLQCSVVIVTEKEKVHGFVTALIYGNVFNHIKIENV